MASESIIPEVEGYKLCGRCKKYLPNDDFDPSPRNGGKKLSSRCRLCVKAILEKRQKEKEDSSSVSSTSSSSAPKSSGRPIIDTCRTLLEDIVCLANTLDTKKQLQIALELQEAKDKIFAKYS